jgi:molybdopterin-synthase adenylyltransferase
MEVWAIASRQLRMRSPYDAESASDESILGLIVDDADRYSRLRLIPWWRQELLARARVLVVGAGALGNEVLKNLALLGLGTIHVIDKDDVDVSNLSRSVLFRSSDHGKSKAEVAAARTLEINPEIRVVPISGDVICDIGLGLFAECDVVIGCLDNREARLWVNRQCWKVGTPWVDAGIQEIQGVVKVFVPPDSACYECAMTKRDYQLLNLRYSCPLLRREEILEGKVPTSPTIASMMAALEVQEALKILHKLPVAAGSAHVFNGVTNQFYTTKLPRRSDCLSHETYPEPLKTGLGNRATATKLFEFLGDSDQPRSIALDRDLVADVECESCGWKKRVYRPRTVVSRSEAVCAKCAKEARPRVVSTVVEGSAEAMESLASLGIPPFDVLRVDHGEDSEFVILDADAYVLDGGRG